MAVPEVELKRGERGFRFTLTLTSIIDRGL
jgi:hypothetical protein